MNQRPAITDATPDDRPGITGLAYGLYAWIAFAVCVSAVFVGMAVLPGLDRRRWWATACGRSFLRAAGIRVTVRGLHRLPEGHCIVVANHASYLDGVILQACLPPRFSYVIKNEVQKVPGMHFLLRRLGSRFVERFAAAGSAAAARSLLRAASAGESLAVFPEGTFIARPGLGRFRLGAFASAIRGDIPLVPVAIRGSRRILPSGAVLPRRGPLLIDVLEPIAPGEDAYTNSRLLAAEARRRILAVLDEPDLLARTPD